MSVSAHLHPCSNPSLSPQAVKLDKRFALAWVVLGHVLAAQEESEHAISAFRSASRLLPGNHFPLVHMAKELVRTNYLSLVRVYVCVHGYCVHCLY